MTDAIHAAGLSTVGSYRDENQDAIRLHTSIPETAVNGQGYLLGVADGMGGCEHGAIASLLALDTFFNAYYAETAGKAQAVLKSAVQQANVAVQRESARLGSVRMGTTLSAVTIIGNRLFVTHVGDSRVYLVRRGHATCLTDDHTQVGDLVRKKLITEDKLRTHERRSVLNRAIGIQLFVQPDITVHTLHAGDHLVLCTDGIWSVVEDAEFGQIVHEAHEPERISERLIDEAMQRDSDDNASVITVHVRDIPHEAPANGKPQGLSKLFSRRA